MFQLMFNDNFDNIERDLCYWKTKEDIPNDIIEYINNISNNRVIYENYTNKFYCSKCTKELDENFYCENCEITRNKYTVDDIKKFNINIQEVDKIDTEDLSNLNNIYNYFVFNINNNNVFLYNIYENVNYKSRKYIEPYITSEIGIDTLNSYYIEKNGITVLDNNQYISFCSLTDYENELNDDSYELEDDKFDIYEKIELRNNIGYIYTDNLSELKNTIYKYSRIWELSSFLKSKNNFSISQLIMYPHFYQSFEYLINYKLYNLAWNASNMFTSGNNFKEIFKVDKKYLKFMVDNNITYEELAVLRFYPTTDINLIRYFSRYYQTLDLLKKYKINLKLLKKCLDENNLSSSYINDYLDYIRIAKEIGLDLNDKKIKYPSNFMEAHDNAYNQIEVVYDPKIDENIRHLADILSFNKYEDDNYVIYPASSIEELVEESRQQKNCVRTYCERISTNESQIYFMRDKRNLNKSLVTIEVYNDRIIQARVKYNKLPDSNLYEILKKWESSLIPVIND